MNPKLKDKILKKMRNMLRAPRIDLVKGIILEKEENMLRSLGNKP